jgi:23S rRNA (uridine2552-2'-O)-methyltransferase
MDFMDEDAPGRLKDALGGAADLVLSDMAANTVGHQQTDHCGHGAGRGRPRVRGRSAAPGGAYVAKVSLGAPTASSWPG